MIQALVTGKNPGLSIAEALSWLDKRGIDFRVRDVSEYALIVESETSIGDRIDELGGTVKVCEIEEVISPRQLGRIPGRGVPGSLHADNTFLAEFKKKWQAPKGGAYSPADLLKKRIEEEAVIQGTGRLYLGRTVAVNNPFEQARRDMKRPVRLGLTISPSRAMILVNLSMATENVLDPFCGSGTIPVEAVVNGVQDIMASDSNRKAVEATRANLEWAKRKYKSNASFRVEQCNARRVHEKFSGVMSIATEPELGPPLREPITRQDAEGIQKYLHRTYSAFLDSAWKAMDDKGTIAIVLPAIRTRRGRLVRQALRHRGFRVKNLWQAVPKGLRKRWMKRTILDEEREPGVLRVVVREFCVLEKESF